METHIDLREGDTLIVHGAAKEAPPPVSQDGLPAPVPESEMSVLVQIGKVKIFESVDGSYVRFTSDLDICNDGTGPDYDDPSYQSQTAYYNGGKFLNADVDKYIVIPPQVRSKTKGVVMGCQGRATNLKTGATYPAVTGEIGPEDKTGEAAYCLAKILNTTVGHNTGDSQLVYLYELWPDVPAVVDGKTYKLEPA